MEDRTEIVETTPETRQVRSAPRTTEVRTHERGAPEVEHTEAVAYDPFENRRMTAYRVTQLIYLIFGIIEGLIIIRFVLKALGANPSAGFADFIYGITYPLILPFIGLFGNPASQGTVLEITSSPIPCEGGDMALGAAVLTGRPYAMDLIPYVWELIGKANPLRGVTVLCRILISTPEL